MRRLVIINVNISNNGQFWGKHHQLWHRMSKIKTCAGLLTLTQIFSCSFRNFLHFHQNWPRFELFYPLRCISDSFFQTKQHPCARKRETAMLTVYNIETTTIHALCVDHVQLSAAMECLICCREILHGNGCSLPCGHCQWHEKCISHWLARCPWAKPGCMFLCQPSRSRIVEIWLINTWLSDVKWWLMSWTVPFRFFVFLMRILWPMMRKT